jgi:hypothetical protein
MRRWLPPVGDELHKPPPSVALDPDQFPDDIVNRTKRRKAALRDDAMRRTIGFFEHRFILKERWSVVFSALRFLVAVLSDLSGCSFVLKVLFSKTLRRR